MDAVVTLHVLKGDPRYAQCHRCLRYLPSDEVGEHPYWPTHRLCGRCVGVLLDIQWSPFILTGGGCYVCSNEKEWHEIMLGLRPIEMDRARDEAALPSPVPTRAPDGQPTPSQGPQSNPDRG